MATAWAWSVLLMLLVPGVAGDWLQVGHDAQRTGHTAADGPMWPDVAFAIQLPEAGPSQRTHPSPVVVGSHAYVAGRDDSGYGSIFAVDLTTGEWQPFAAPRVLNALGNPQMYGITRQLASDGHRLYALTAHGHLFAYDLEDGASSWSWQAGSLARDPTSASGVTICSAVEMAVTAQDLFVACNHDQDQSATFRVWRIDTATGREVWEYDWRKHARADPDSPPIDPDPAQLRIDERVVNAESGGRYLPTGISVLDGLVVVAVRVNRAPSELAPQAPSGFAQNLYLGLNAEGDERFAWLIVDAVAGGPHGPDMGNWAPAATGTEAAAYLELTELAKVRAGETEPTRVATMRQPSFDGEAGSGLALAPEGIYAASRTTMQLFDADLAFIRSWTLPEGQEWARGSPVRTGNGLLIARAGPIDADAYWWLRDAGTIYALEARTLRPIWMQPSAVNCAFAVSDGFVVRWCADGMFSALGTGASSIKAAAEASARYPATGQVVRVDMAATRAGAFGEATEFRADWGDGTESEWQDSPRFAHQFVVPADAHARFYARNANQSASIPITFHVGQRDPAITIWNSPFDTEYQETSFFFLGLVATALLGAVGIFRAGRKRRIFRRALRRLEEDVQRMGADVKACNEMLNARRSEARALFLQKKIEEAHASFLERRVEELRRGLRLGTIEAKLKFLPYGMVAQLQGLLADARVDAWERMHFIDALEAQPSLSVKQRKEARAIIDEWFARDVELRSS